MGTYAKPSGIRMDFTTDERECLADWQHIPIGYTQEITPGNVVQLHRVNPAFRFPPISAWEAVEFQRLYASEKSFFDAEVHALERGSVVYRTPDELNDVKHSNSKLFASITNTHYVSTENLGEALAVFGVSEEDASHLSKLQPTRADEKLVSDVKSADGRITKSVLGETLYKSTYNAYRAFLRFLECAERNGNGKLRFKLVRSMSVPRDQGSISDDNF